MVSEYSITHRNPFGQVKREMSYLEWTRPVRVLPTQIKLTHNRKSHKEPVAEAVVVNELEDVLHTQVDQCQDTIEE